MEALGKLAVGSKVIFYFIAFLSVSTFIHPLPKSRLWVRGEKEKQEIGKIKGIMICKNGKRKTNKKEQEREMEEKEAKLVN